VHCISGLLGCCNVLWRCERTTCLYLNFN
jgi:hypothetical protein